MSRHRNKLDSVLYREYGRVMRAAQTFEYTVRELVFLSALRNDDDDRSTVEVDAEIARFFKRPLAKLARQLDVDEDFADELRVAVSTRNTLAHEYFMTTFLELNVGLATHKQLIETLTDARRRYESVNGRLDALVAARHKALEIETTGVLTTQDEMRRAMLGDTRTATGYVEERQA